MDIKEIKNKVNGIEARNNALKKQQEHNERLDMCVYEALEKHALGKEWLDSYKMALLDEDNGKRMTHQNIMYRVGQEDFVRRILLQIDRHKARMSGKLGGETWKV